LLFLADGSNLGCKMIRLLLLWIIADVVDTETPLLLLASTDGFKSTWLCLLLSFGQGIAKIGQNIHDYFKRYFRFTLVFFLLRRFDF
jgi:hypothetical protein